jgi:hypothetical protein
MDILYYSRFCKHSNKIIEFLSKHGITTELNCICIDRRTTTETGQVMVQLENGKQEGLPPMIDRVPALLLTTEKYQIRFGDEIIEHYKGKVKKDENEATQCNEGEHLAFQSDSFSSSFSSF